MDILLKNKIIELSDQYETIEFIDNDPIKFPLMYYYQEDIEIAGIIASWLAYGNRKIFLPIIEKIFNKYFVENNVTPCEFVRKNIFEKESLKGNNERLYRFYTHSDLYDLFYALRQIYDKYSNIETALFFNIENRGLETDPLQGLIDLFPPVKGIPQNVQSACKRMCMFMRWMARKNSPVDIGVWRFFDPKFLLVPTDTHVISVSYDMGLIDSKKGNMKTVLQLTHIGKEIWPNDPSKLDFALYGSEINNKSNI